MCGLTNLPNYMLGFFKYIELDMEKMVKLMINLPKDIMDILLENLHNNLAILLLSIDTEGMDDNKLSAWKVLLKVMDILYKCNKISKVVDKKDFINETCSSQIDLKRATEQWFKKNRRKNQDNTSYWK